MSKMFYLIFHSIMRRHNSEINTAQIRFSILWLHVIIDEVNVQPVSRYILLVIFIVSFINTLFLLMSVFLIFGMC